VLPEIRTSINLRIDIRIPEEYIPDFNQRLSLYKWISSAQDRDELDRIQGEMRDRYGKIPRQGANLFTLAELRILAEKLRVASADYAGEKISVRFSPDASLAPHRLIEVVSKSRGAVLTPQGVVRLPVGPGEEARVEAVRALLKALL